MDGNVIFQNPASNAAPPEPNAGSQPQNEAVPASNAASPLSNEPLSSSNVASSPFYPTPPSSGGLGKIVKILLGLTVFVLIGFLIVNVLIPRFFQKGKSEKVTLVYWGLWEDKRIMQPAIDEFQRLNPNITIDYAKQDIKQYRERLSARAKVGTGPDIFRFHNSWLPMISSLLLPLSKDTIAKADFEKWFYSVSQKDLIKNGGIYGIPLQTDTLSLYTNSQMFEAQGISQPTNWVDFATLARQLTIKDGEGKIQVAGAAIGTYTNIAHAPDIISMLFAQNGVDLNNLSEVAQSASEALTFYTAFAQGDGKVWDETLDNSTLSFAKGKLAMYFGYSWDFFTIKALNPDLSFSISPVPHLPNRNITIASYWAEGVSAYTRYQKEALLFMKFLARKETAEKLFKETAKTRSFGEPYGRVDLADLLKNNSSVYPFVSQAKEATSSYFAADTFDNGLNSQMNSYLENAVNSIIKDGTSPQTAVETLTQGVVQVLKQYGGN